MLRCVCVCIYTLSILVEWDEKSNMCVCPLNLSTIFFVYLNWFTRKHIEYEHTKKSITLQPPIVGKGKKVIKILT